MERERSRQEQTADTDKLYPQIAEALNISISQLEQYPSDMKQILCQAYINNCELGKDDVAEALNGIVILMLMRWVSKRLKSNRTILPLIMSYGKPKSRNEKTNGHTY